MLVMTFIPIIGPRLYFLCPKINVLTYTYFETDKYYSMKYSFRCPGSDAPEIYPVGWACGSEPRHVFVRVLVLLVVQKKRAFGCSINAQVAVCTRRSWILFNGSDVILYVPEPTASTDSCNDNGSPSRVLYFNPRGRPPKSHPRPQRTVLLQPMNCIYSVRILNVESHGA